MTHMFERERTVIEEAANEAPRVAFQGERGAFSEEAAYALFGRNVRAVPRASFESLFSAIEEGAADFALAPAENSLAGTVHRTFDLLLESDLTIASEAALPVRHCLIGCAGASLASVRTVESHPVALAQCERFFSNNPHIVRLASDDTAASARRVTESGDPTRAAIASARAATIYGGEILLEGLEDHSENYTRFLLLARSPIKDERADKLSLVARLPHEPGALHAALEPFARRRIDILRIESRPVRGEPWRYRFFLDLQTGPDDPRIAAALAELERRAEEVRVLGFYASARHARAAAHGLTHPEKLRRASQSWSSQCQYTHRMKR